MLTKYTAAIKKEKNGMSYRKNLQFWGESIEEVSRHIKAKLQKDQEYFGYKLIRIESLKDHTYINYDIIL